MIIPSIAFNQINASEKISIRNINEYMQNHLSHYLREVSDLCAIDSGTYDKAGVDRVALCLAERLRGLGMEVSRKNGVMTCMRFCTGMGKGK